MTFFRFSSRLQELFMTCARTSKSYNCIQGFAQLGLFVRQIGASGAQ